MSSLALAAAKSAADGVQMAKLDALFQNGDNALAPFIHPFVTKIDLTEKLYLPNIRAAHGCYITTAKVDIKSGVPFNSVDKLWFPTE